LWVHWRDASRAAVTIVYGLDVEHDGISDMNTIFKLVAFIGVLWVVDILAYGGRYSSAVIEQASYEGQMVQYDIQDWLKRIGI
jgi:hypothetical protein